MVSEPNIIRTVGALTTLFLAWGQGPAGAQGFSRFFPDRSFMPYLLAGPRDPSFSFSPLWVGQNPNAHGAGVEVEVSLGTAIPVILLSAETARHTVVVGVEAAVFARFGLQVLERELIATDWVFAVPVVWRRPGGWLRFKYHHTSSHMGDEYARRFQSPGINFARDAAEIAAFGILTEQLGVFCGARYAYIVHPEDSKRWVVRVGSQLEAGERGRRFRPFLATDLEWDQEAGGIRIEVQGGAWLPEVGGRRALRLALVVLSGPSPLGQFNGLSTTQVGLTLRGNL
jgi:hypothetical protein